ncbi:unnamed protein product, partial [Allacma fusca]
MRSISKFCIANLAWANLCVGVFCIYQNLTMFIIDSWIFGSFFCKMYHFITSVSSTASTLILVVISVERYMVILHPFKCRQILTIKRLRWIILGVWLSSGILCLPKLLYVMLIHHRKLSRSGGSNGSEVICTMSPNMFSDETAELVQFILLFILPMSIISFLYYKVGVTLRQREAFSETFVSASIFEYEPQLSHNRPPSRVMKSKSCPKKGKEKEPLVTVPLQSISTLRGGTENIPQTKAIRSNICENCQKHWSVHNRQARGCSHAPGIPTHVLRNIWGEDCFPFEGNIFQSIPPERIPCSSKLIRINFSGSAVCCHDCGFFCCHTKISSTHRPHKDVEPIDYSKIQSPFLLTVFPMQQVLWRYNRTRAFFMAKSQTPHIEKLSPIHGGRIFRMRNLVCKTTLVTSADVFDETNFQYSLQRPGITLVEYIFNMYYVKAKMNDLIVLIANNSTVTEFIVKATRTIKREVEFHAQVFVLFPKVGALQEDTYSGYYACWFSVGCMIEFNCSAPGCLDSMWQVFNSATNFGKKTRPGTTESVNIPRVRPQSFLGSPFQRKKSWTLHETLHFFLLDYVDSNFTLSENFYKFAKTPSISYNRYQIHITRPDVWIFPLSHRSGFNFITSDGVAAVTHEYSLYTSPIELTVWLCLLGATLVVAASLSSETFRSGGLRKSFFQVMFDLFANLLEQGWDMGK